jgi:hypothetical protein
MRSFILAPISEHHCFTRSRSSGFVGSGQRAVERVDWSSFRMYIRSDSDSNPGRGEDAAERGGGGERRPDMIEVQHTGAPDSPSFLQSKSKHSASPPRPPQCLSIRMHTN